MSKTAEESIVENTTVEPKKKEYELRMVGSLDFHEVSVAFRKVLKDIKSYEACFFAFVLLQSGYHKHLLKHLAIYASQLESNQVIEISAHRNCFDLNTTAKNRKMEDGFCYICRAINSLTGSNKKPKSLMNKVINNYCNANHLKLKD